ncbi:hypothetical protein [Staphylococcus capitis]|uniref:hypothetical protein n=1 Tax=Staphylococcus capitis TaxID=29388 RepID=UPI000D1BA72C|nr:hypothetical protein [Staphylococcus capitis]PUZ19047.1 hypothetical protein BU611_02525 [Staphylococcus capitis]
MNYMDLYLQQFLKSTIKNSIDEYKMILDKKLKSIESYINYLSEKRVQLKKLIDSLTLSLENKYIDIVNNHDIYCAEEIHDVEIEKIKTKLDDIEAYYTRIEADLHLQSKEKITTENECNLIYHMSAVA